MDTIQLEPKHDLKQVERAFRGLLPVPEHALFNITKNTAVSAPDGSPLLVYLKGVIPEEKYKPAMKDWWEASKDELSNRSSAMHADRAPGIKKDGTETNFLRVPQEVLDKSPARQGIVGTVVAKGQCYKTNLTVAKPWLIDNHLPLIELVSNLYKYHLPRTYARQWDMVKDKPNAHIGRTVFSTGYFVKQLQCGLHPDMKNMRNVMSCIFPMGKFEGAELVLLRWRIKVSYNSGDLLLFIPQYYHGNLPFTGFRMSAIFYLDKNIGDCK